MDKPISVGDLVQVVRWPCCGRALGSTYVVAFFKSVDERGCKGCGAALPPAMHAYSEVDPADGLPYAIPVQWLKRIPPLDELEGEKRDEDLREPA